MKFEAIVNDEKLSVEIERSENGCVNAVVDGRKYDIDVSEPEPGVFLIKNDGRISQFYVAPPSEPGGMQIVSSSKHQFEIRLIDPKRLRGSSSGDADGEGKAEIRTNMPGKVVRIVASPGTAVEKGEPVIVVEAMKMQNDLKAPRSGSVKEIRVSEGATVAAGDVLAVIE